MVLVSKAGLSRCLGTGGGLGEQGRFKLVFGDWRWSW